MVPYVYLVSLAIENPNCSTILILPTEFQLLKTNKTLSEFSSNDFPDALEVFKKSSDSSEVKSGEILWFSTCFLPIAVISAIFLAILLIVLIVVAVKCVAMKKRGKYVLPIDEYHRTDSRPNNSKELPSQLQEKSSEITEKDPDPESSIISGNTSLTQQLTLEPSKSVEFANKK
uniref:Uncharacterized protein n=1 Tax=Panagrolaimus sp. JU765 TaxID=591449 RepID=A0AC34QYJ3_9BILA